MTFFAALFTAVFANNVILVGHGLKDSYDLIRIKTKKPWLLLAVYFLEALILGGFAFLWAALAKNNVLWKYLSLLFNILIMALLLTGFYHCMKKFLPDFATEIRNKIPEVMINTSLITVCIEVLELVLNGSSTALVFGSILGYPLGFLLSTFVFRAVMERIEVSNAPKGFRTMPLLLLVTAGLCLSMTMLSFLN